MSLQGYGKRDLEESVAVRLQQANPGDKQAHESRGFQDCSAFSFCLRGGWVAEWREAGFFLLSG